MPASPSEVPLPREGSVRRTALRVASRLEEEVRAYPRLHGAFYWAVTRNARVRDLIGRIKDQVRADGAAPALRPRRDDAAVLHRRRAGLRRRLLPLEDGERR